MGNEIVYCFNCGTRLLASAFEKEGAVRIRQDSSCAQCLPKLLERLSPQERNAYLRKTEPKLSVPRPATTRKIATPAPAPRPSSSKAAWILGGVAAVVGVTVLALLLGSGDKPGPVEPAPPPSPKTAAKPPTPAPGGTQAPATEEVRRPPAESRLDRLLAEIKPSLEADAYPAALGALEKAKDMDATPAWILKVDQMIATLRMERDRKVEEVRSKAGEARSRGDAAGVAAQRNRIAALGGPALLESFDRTFAAAPTEEPKPPSPKVRSEEGKAYLEKWREAMRPAADRDYEAASRLLSKASQGLTEDSTRTEAAEDLKDLQALAALHQAALKAAGIGPTGLKVALDLRGRDRVEGILLHRDADHWELRKGVSKDLVFIDFADLGARSLLDLVKEPDPRAAALWLALEGAAREGAGGFPAKFSELPKEGASRTDALEREARQIYWKAARDFEEAATFGAALDAYRTLAKDFVGTRVVTRNVSLITRRSEGGREYYFPASALPGNGVMKLKEHPEFQYVWFCPRDVDGAEVLETYVEFEFWALPKTAYACWVHVGACCQETFVGYLQATELKGPNPRKSSERISFDVGTNVAAPVDPKLKGLKKLHSQHGGEKQAVRWEWVAIPLPAYAEGGLKKVRLLADQKGYSVSQALVTSLRKAPPKDAELAELRKRAEEDAKAKPKREVGLAGHWTFDDVAGGVVKDLSGNGLDGRIQGNPKAVPGKIGTALEFTADGDGVEIPDFAWPEGGPITIAFWNHVEAKDVRAGCAFGVGGGAHRIMLHGPWGDRNLYWDYGELKAKGRIIAGYAAGLGKWTHIAVVSGGNGGKFKGIYIDGALAASSPDCEGPAMPMKHLSIGHWGKDYHGGRIDDFRIYSRVLDAEEIRRLGLGIP